MRAFILGFLIFCLWAVFARYYYVCEIKNHCTPTVAKAPSIEDERLATLLFTDGDSVILKEYDQFAFDSSSITARITDNNSQFLDSVASYLSKYPDKALTLTGYARSTESGQDAGFYENLGAARAAVIRDLLVRRGLSEDRFFIKHNIISGDQLLEPITFNAEVGARPEDFNNQGERLVRERFTFTNMTYSDANFAHNSAEFLPGDAFKFYADSVKTYFDLNPKKGLTILGHTDSDGNDSYNENLGLNRAKAARQYFQELGVSATIKVGTKGEKEPVAPNDSPENKQRNRRVNFIIE